MKAYNLASQNVDNLRRIRAEFEAERKAIQANPNYSQSFKDRLIAQARQYAEGQAYAAAANGAKALKQAQAQAIDELRRVTLAKDDAIDAGRLNWKTTEYLQALRSAPNDAARLQVLDKLTREAQYSPTTRRALALAAGDLLQSGEFAQRASAQRATLTKWSEEEAAPIAQAERELNGFEPALAEFRRVALEEESALTGQYRYSGMLSEWQKSVFGESHESLSHIVWNTDDMTAASQPIPKPSAPSGIEN